MSFTFGVPDRAVVSAPRAAGRAVLITVTSADEARAALLAGIGFTAARPAPVGEIVEELLRR
nr:nitronate monooxygenase [Actinoplanes ferrugineus]